jgi:hypothetical protein
MIMDIAQLFVEDSNDFLVFICGMVTAFLIVWIIKMINNGRGK